MRYDNPSKPHLENRKRSATTFIINESKGRMMPIVFGSLIGALIVHIVLFALSLIFDIRLFPVSAAAPPEVKEERITVIPSKEEEDTPSPVNDLPLEPITAEDVDPPDIIDIPLEDATISPEETSIVFTENMLNDQGNQDSAISHVSIDNIPMELPSPMDDPIYTNANSVSINVPSVDNVDPLSDTTDPGTGGNDNAADPMGNESLRNLLAMPGGTLGSEHKATLQADLLFEYNKAELKQTAHIGLILLGALMQKNPETRFIIEGHTDSFGTAAYNRKLSFLRANAVREWLAANGLPLDRVYIRACAADNPVVSIVGSKEEQSANRRVEIHMRKSAEKLPDDALPASISLEEFLTTPQATKATTSTSINSSEKIQDVEVIE